MDAKKLELLKKKFGYKNNTTEKTIVDALLEVPQVDKKGVNVPTTDVFERNTTHQLDLLFLPDDEGYQYCLTVVDLANPRYIGAEKLKDKNSASVLKALQTIYKKNKFLDIPKRLEMDSGGEFKGDFKDHWNNLNIDLAYKKAGRSRQQACVEAVNGVLGHYLFKRMLANEIAMKGEELDAEWIEELPELVDLINELKKQSLKKKRRQTKRQKMSENGTLLVGKDDTLQVLPIGTKVRVISDEPKTIQGLKESSKDFRATDIRWELPIREIKQLSLRPNQPPMYLIEGIDNAAYTKQQLQVVKDNEKPPHFESVKKYIVEAIVGKKKEKNKIMYNVKWKHFPSDKNTWEPRTQLLKNVPDIVKEYDKNNK